MRRSSIITGGFNDDGVPTVADVMNQRRPSNYEAVQRSGKKTQDNTTLTGASALTLKQSLVPLILVTTLFFVSPNRTSSDLCIHTDVIYRCGASRMVFLIHSMLPSKAPLACLVRKLVGSRLRTSVHTLSRMLHVTEPCVNTH